MTTSTDVVFPGQDVVLTFTLTNPNGLSTDVLTEAAFEFDSAAFGPGLTFTNFTPPVSCASGGGISSAGNLLYFHSMTLAPSESCVMTVTLSGSAYMADFPPPGLLLRTSPPRARRPDGVVISGNYVETRVATTSLPPLTMTVLTDRPTVVTGEAIEAYVDIQSQNYFYDVVNAGYDFDPAAFFPGLIVDQAYLSPSCGPGAQLISNGGTFMSLRGATIPKIAGSSESYCRLVLRLIPPFGSNGTYTLLTSLAHGTSLGRYQVSPAAGSTTFQVTSTNTQPPQMGGLEPSVSYDIGTGPMLVDTSLSLSDPDSGTLWKAVVAMTSGFVQGEDILGASYCPATLPCIIDNSAGTITFEGIQDHSLYLAALQSITYQSTASQPAATPKILTYQVFDRSALASPVYSTQISMKFPSRPVTVSTSVSPGTVAAGGRAVMSYTFSLPPGSADAEFSMAHDIAATLPGAQFDPNLLPAAPCGTGSQVALSSGNRAVMSGFKLAAGESCTLQLTFDTHGSNAAGTYTLTTGAVSTVTNGITLTSDAATTNLTLLAPVAPQFSFQIFPPSAPAGAQRVYRFTMSLDPSAPAGVKAMRVAGSIRTPVPPLVTMGAVPATPCGPNSAIVVNLTTFDTNGFSFTGGSLEPGQSCTVDIPFTVPADRPVGLLSANAFSMTFQPASRIGGPTFTASGYQDTLFEVTAPAPDAPVLTPPADQTLSAAAGLATGALDVTSLGSVSVAAGAIPAIVYRVGSTVLTGAYDFPIGTTTVTMDAQDEVGTDAAQVSFLVTVTDDEAPVLTPPAAIARATDAGVATALVDVTSLGAVADNSGVVPAISYRVGGVDLTGAYAFPIGTTNVTMEATDAAGNAATPVSFDVVVTDNEAPVLTPPANQTAPTDPGVGTATLDVTALGTVTDNSGVTPAILYRVGSTTLAGDYAFPVGVTTVTMDASDSDGNAATPVTFTVTVTDSVPPTLSVANIQSPLDPGSANAIIPLYVTTSDLSGGPVTVAYLLGGAPITSPYAFPAGVSTVTAVATDPSGNATQADFTVTVFPDQPLEMTSSVSGGTLLPGSPVTYQLNLRNPNGVPITDAAAVVALGTQATLLSPPGLTVTYQSMSGGCTGNGFSAPGGGAPGFAGANLTLPANTTCTFTASIAVDATTPTGTVPVFGISTFDSAGATFQGVYEGLTPLYVGVPPADTQPPALTVPADITTTADAGRDSAVVDFSVSALDDVDGDLSSQVTLSHSSGARFPIGVTTVTADVSDAAGNAASQASFTITVTDTEAPVLTPPATQEIVTDPGQPFGTFDVTTVGTVADNSGTAPPITYRNGGFVLTGAGGFAVGDTTITMDASDAAGNVATQVSFIVRVRDAEAPVISPPADQSVQTDASQNSASLDVTSLGQVVDNVGVPAGLTYRVGGTVLTGPYVFPLGPTVVTMDAQDAAGNAAPQASFTVTVTDGEAPVLTPPANQSAPADPGLTTATLDVTALGTVSDNDPTLPAIVYRVGGAALGGAYAFPLGSTTVTMDATDAAGNAAAQVSFTVTVTDQQSPTIALSADRTTLGGGEVAQITFTLSEDATDFVDTDIVVEGGTLSGFNGSGAAYSAVFTPAADSTGTGRVYVGDAAFSDPSGNLNADGADADNSVIFQIDTERPTASLGTLQGPFGGTYTVQVTLSEPSTTFTADDLDLVNATATLAGSGTSYNATLTPVAGGPLSVTVRAGSFTDAQGNTNAAASNTATATFDSERPSVTISGLLSAFTSTQPLTANITFSEPVTGFALDDVSISNAVLQALIGSGANYTVTMRPTGQGDVTLGVPQNVAFDAAGNGNTAATAVSAANRTVEETEQKVARFIANRTTQLVSSQPNLTCHLAGGCKPRHFDLVATQGAVDLSLASRPNSPVWFQFSGRRTIAGTARSDYAFGAIGTHTRIGRDTILGVLLEFDHVGQTDGASQINGTGWLAGPYFVTKLPDQPLYVEARLLAGKTANQISPFGTYVDEFETKRALAMVKVSGYLKYGKTTLTPSLAGTYAREVQASYTDTLGNVIDAQGFSLGQLDVSIDFETPIQFGAQAWLVGGGATATFSKSSGTGPARATLSAHNSARGQVRFAARTEFPSGWRLNIATNYDGIGVKDYRSYGIDLQLDREF